MLHAQRKETTAGVHREEFNFQVGGNVCSVYHVEDGNTKQAFQEADEILENTYTQPRCNMAISNLTPQPLTGNLAASSSPYRDSESFRRSGAAGADFKLPENQVQIIVPLLGGG